MQSPSQSLALQSHSRVAPRALASAYRRSKNIRIEAIVVTELKLCDVKWQIFCADFVERADDAAFEYRPETLNRIHVYGTDDVSALLVLDRLAWIFCQPIIDV